MINLFEIIQSISNNNIISFIMVDTVYIISKLIFYSNNLIFNI